MAVTPSVARSKFSLLFLQFTHDVTHVIKWTRLSTRILPVQGSYAGLIVRA